jgi:5-methylthioadenosine/S-adenosylhomocysteine deaminase
MCFHTTFSCSAEFIQQAHRLGEELGVLVHMHCSEGVHEPEYALQHFGVRPMEYYDRLGAANARMLASQCVQMSDRGDRDHGGARGEDDAHAALQLRGGRGHCACARTGGCGRDRRAGQRRLRQRFLRSGARHVPDPQGAQAGSARHAGAAGLVSGDGGRRACAGMEKVGRIAEGWQADLQLVDTRMPTPTEVHNLYDQLVLWRSHKHVRLVMVAGQVRVRDGVVLGADEEAIIARAHAAARRLWAM